MNRFAFITVAALSAIIHTPFASAQEAPHGKFPQGTKIATVLQHDVTSKRAEVGDGVKLTVANDVTLDNVVVIKAGTEVAGEVGSVDGKSWGGMPGSVSFSAREIPLQEYAKPLRVFCFRSATGEDKELSTVGVMFGVGLLKRGGDGVIRQGTVVQCEIVDYAWLQPR